MDEVLFLQRHFLGFPWRWPEEAATGQALLDYTAYRASDLGEKGRYAAALALACKNAEKVAARNSHEAVRFRHGGLEAALKPIGERLFASCPTACDASEPRGAPQTICYLLTAVYPNGGHTRVLEDMVRAIPEAAHHVVLNNIGLQQGPDARSYIRAQLNGFVHLRAGDLEQRFGELVGEIARLKPSRLVVLSHPHDAVIAALPFRRLARHTVFVHHANHGFFLGGGLEAVRHTVLDVFDKTFVAANYDGCISVLPLTCADPYRENAFDATAIELNSAFLTITAGSPHKFKHREGRRYSDLLRARYRARGGRHIHIGHITDDLQREIEAVLRATGAADRFENIPFVPSVSETLARLSPDLYFVSHPTGGSKTCIEAMAAACPISVCPRGNAMDGDHVLYPGHMAWDNAIELENLLRSYSVAEKGCHAALARDYYLQNHAPGVFERIWREILDSPVGQSGHGRAVKPGKRYRVGGIG